VLEEEEVLGVEDCEVVTTEDVEETELEEDVVVELVE